MTIQGVNITHTGLSINTATGAFSDTTAINTSASLLLTALSTLRTDAASFGGNATLIQTRQDFTTNLINSTQMAMDNLVQYDTNAAGAERRRRCKPRIQLGIVLWAFPVSFFASYPPVVPVSKCLGGWASAHPPFFRFTYSLEGVGKMPLKIRVKPEAKIYAGGAVLKNVGNRPADLLILSDSPVLREDYMMNIDRSGESDANNVYFLLQVIYLFKGKGQPLDHLVIETIKNFAKLYPHFEAQIGQIIVHLEAGESFKALKTGHKLLAEQETKDRPKPDPAPAATNSNRHLTGRSS